MAELRRQAEAEQAMIRVVQEEHVVHPNHGSLGGFKYMFYFHPENWGRFPI